MRIVPNRSRPAPLFALLLSAILPAPGPALALTLGEAQAALFRDNPDLAVLKLETERAEAQVREARAAWLPSLDAFGSYAYTTETGHLQLDLPFPAPAGTHLDRAMGDHDRVESGLDASYPLFTGFARGRKVEAQRLGARAREAQWRAARNQLSLRLAALFYAWQLAGSQASYQEKLLRYSRELEKQAQEFLKAGTAVRSRLLSAQARSRSVEVELLTARNARDSLAFEVLAFLGGPGDAGGVAGAGDSSEAAVLKADTNALADPSWSAPGDAVRPDAEALDLGSAQARMGAKALAGQKWPQLYGSAGWRYANPGLDLAGDEFMNYGILGLQLKWNLFDGSRNGAQRAQLETQARALAEQKRKLEREWRKSMAVSRLQYARWEAQYAAAQSSREAAQAAAADVKRQLDAGVATDADWLEARNGEARAELAMEQARTMQRLARLQWEYAAGRELRF
jgi:outer membrane protein TolC